MTDFPGKVAVITGAASGIGAGLARHAASLGMKLALADFNGDGLQEVAGGLATGAITATLDVRDADAFRTFADTVYDRFGTVDLLFNNAGVLHTGYSWEIADEAWKASWDVNINGIVNGLRAFVPRLIAAAQPARIINTASVGGFLPSPMMAPYSMTKSAVIALSECLMGELDMLGSPVKISVLAPGPVKSRIMHQDATGDGQRFRDTLQYLQDKHGLTPDEFAPLVFEAIARGDYWIVPQPESLDADLKRRMDSVYARTQPYYYRFIEASEGEQP